MLCSLIVLPVGQLVNATQQEAREITTRTFAKRREWITSDTADSSIDHILEKFPLYKYPTEVKLIPTKIMIQSFFLGTNENIILKQIVNEFERVVTSSKDNQASVEQLRMILNKTSIANGKWSVNKTSMLTTTTN